MSRRKLFQLGLAVCLLAGGSPRIDAAPAGPSPAETPDEMIIARDANLFAKTFPLILQHGQIAEELNRKLQASTWGEREFEQLELIRPAGCECQPKFVFLAVHQARAAAGDEARLRLQDIRRLADGSRLYAPAPDGSPNQLFAFGSVAATKDYLDRQRSRVAVLGAYATPYLEFLGSTPTTDNAQSNGQAIVDYWKNTLAELNRALQLPDQDGAVGKLERLFLEVLTGLTPENSGERLAKSPAAAAEFGNDLFSEARRKLLDQVRRQSRKGN